MGSAVVRGLGLRASPSLLRSLGFVSENSLARLQNLNLHVGEEHSPAVSLLLETHHIVSEQYSIEKEYPKYSVSRKSHLIYSNERKIFQTNQILGAF